MFINTHRLHSGQPLMNGKNTLCCVINYEIVIYFIIAFLYLRNITDIRRNLRTSLQFGDVHHNWGLVNFYGND